MILIVGGGSIGRRHLRNLRELGAGPLGVVEPDAKRRQRVRDDHGCEVFADLDGGLDRAPARVLVTSPTHLHAGQTLAALARGCDVFVEKPLCDRPEDLAPLAEAARDAITLVGCNMRFHPGPAAVKAAIERGDLGRILCARLYAGSHLPGWHPGEDYRAGYSANAAMGGGCILDFIHEIDLARWLLGNVERVYCEAGHLSALEIDVEDVASIVCRHAGGAISSIHLDYVQRPAERGIRVVGEAGVARWDMETDSPPAGWEFNQVYLDEMTHWLSCCETRRATTLPIADAVEVTRVALAAKLSAGSHNAVHTKDVP